MKILNHCIKLQKVTSKVTIGLAVVLAVYCLGFMTNFFVLFMDGNDEMYSLYKDLQPVNTFIFFWGVAFLVLNLSTSLFDLQKKAAGPFGFGYTAIIAILSVVFGTKSIALINETKATYSGIDFSSLKDYTASTLPFSIVMGLYALSILLAVVFCVVSAMTFFGSRKQGEVNEK